MMGAKPSSFATILQTLKISFYGQLPFLLAQSSKRHVDSACIEGQIWFQTLLEAASSTVAMRFAGIGIMLPALGRDAPVGWATAPSHPSARSEADAHDA